VAYGGNAALVTGASSGIGEAFARALTARGREVLLSGLPEDHTRLETIAGELRQQHHVRVEVAPFDLAEPDAAHRLQAAADALGFEPTLLVNSDGIGAGGVFAEAHLERHLQMVAVNIAALVALTGLYLPRMIARHHGRVINVASTAALGPIPYFAVYAASKTFVLSFSEAIWAENHRRGVRVVAICPGPVATAFHERAGDTESSAGVQGRIKRRYMTPERVVDIALDALARDRPTVVLRLPGFGLVSLPVAMAQILVPRRLWLLGSERLSRWYFRQLAPPLLGKATGKGAEDYR